MERATSGGGEKFREWIESASIGDRAAALNQATVSGQIDLVEELLKAGVSPDGVDERFLLKWTALFYAVDHEKKSIAEKLIRAGADVDKQSAFGITVLMMSVDSNFPDLVSLILMNDADTNIKDGQEKTALHYAVRRHDWHSIPAPGVNFDVVRLLLRNNAHVVEKDKHGNTPLLSVLLDFWPSNGMWAVPHMSEQSKSDLFKTIKHLSTSKTCTMSNLPTWRSPAINPIQFALNNRLKDVLREMKRGVGEDEWSEVKDSVTAQSGGDQLWSQVEELLEN